MRRLEIDGCFVGGVNADCPGEVDVSDELNGEHGQNDSRSPSSTADRS